jgi:hypothetical protein
LLSAAALEDRPRVKALLGELQKRQNPDGGWSWRPKGAIKGASDPFGTGQVLHAVGMTAGAGADPAVGQATSRARTFLLNTQKPDGTWDSPSRKPGAPDNEIAAYWGTTWAIIGLAATAASAR